MDKPGFSEQHLMNNEMFYTEKEIWGQPSLWQKVYEQVLQEKQPVLSFLRDATLCENLNIILTGAGSSAFIGLSLAGVFRRNFKKHTMAVSTTDLVTHPLDYLSSDIPVLMISFARSGNSPESIAAACTCGIDSISGPTSEFKWRMGKRKT